MNDRQHFYIYTWWDGTSPSHLTALYVGITNSPGLRAAQHFNAALGRGRGNRFLEPYIPYGGHPPPRKEVWVSIEYYGFVTRPEAETEERRRIQTMLGTKNKEYKLNTIKDLVTIRRRPKLNTGNPLLTALLKARWWVMSWWIRTVHAALAVTLITLWWTYHQ